MTDRSDTRKVSAMPGESAATSEWRSGGAVLIVAMVCSTCVTLPFSFLGTLIMPLSTEFAWSRAEISSALLICTTGTFLVAPVTGYLVDRLGPRRVALVGLCLVICANILLGTVGPSIASWYAAWIVFAVVQAIASNVVWMDAVVSRFHKNRGLAVALTGIVQALSFGAMPSIAVFVITEFGWRALFFLTSAFVLVIAVPLTWKFFYSARELTGLRTKIEQATATARAGPADRAFTTTLQDRRFWQIAIAYIIAPAAVATLVVHLQPILIDAGASATAAAAVAVILGPAQVVGRFGMGYLLDRYSPSVIGSAFFLLPCLSYAILLVAGISSVSMCLAALFIGMAFGQSTILPVLVSRYFGDGAFGRVYGIILGIYSMGFGIAPVVAGAAYDATRSYELIFLVMLIGSSISPILIGTLGHPRTIAKAGAD
jgi:MFS family permease